MTVKVNMPELVPLPGPGEESTRTGKKRIPGLPNVVHRPNDDEDTALDLPLRRLAGPEWEEEVTEVSRVADRRHDKTSGLPISRGDLSKRPFAELLAEIYRWRADGALLISNGQNKKVVYFRKGRPIFVKSNSLSECLGRILIREKLIKEADCEESLKQMKRRHLLQGTTLIEMGRLSPHNLVFALGLQLRTKLFDLFAWQKGRFELDPQAEMPPEPIELELTTAAIIYEGIKRSYTDGRVANALRDVRDHYPQPAADPLYRYQDLGLDEEGAKLLASIDGSRTTAQLVAKSRLRPMAVRRLLLAMRIAQVLEFESERRTDQHVRPTPPPLKPALKARAAAPPLPASPPPRPPPARATASSLAEELAALRRKSYYDILGAEASTPAPELRAAYLELAKTYHPDKHYSSASAEIRELAAEIYHLISVAYETLSDPDDRKTYDAERAAGPQGEDSNAIANVLAAEGKFQRGEQLLREKRYKAATAAFAQAVELYGEEGEFHAYLGWSLFLGNPRSEPVLAQALDEIEKALRLNPKVDKSYLFLGYIQKATGRPDKAERSFERALQCNPDCLEALHELRLRSKPGRR